MTTTVASSGAHDEIMTNFTLAHIYDNTNSFDHELNRGQKIIGPNHKKYILNSYHTMH